MSQSANAGRQASKFAKPSRDSGAKVAKSAGHVMQGTKQKQVAAKSANNLEQSRALRSVQALQLNLNLPPAKLPAVLTYLRWLDKMEAWNAKRTTTINEASARLRDTEALYSWQSGFGNPIVLPKIKKQRDEEKYSSAQVKKSVFECDVTKKSAPKSSVVARRREASKKPTAFYMHAMNGFKYWPTELYKPAEPAGKYSFGDRFNPGRAGVINDRIYTRPKANKHYWTEFQLHQNPIGSGNAVTGPVLRN